MILNTQQIILLCLLVSFVTSIATGITTVSLLQQSPEPVTQTINRVIERTVETVTQQPIDDIKEEIKNALSKDLPTTPKKEVVTVVVNQEEQSINAVQKNENSIARLYVDNKDAPFVTMGIVMNTKGDVLVDKRMIEKRATYNAVYGTRTFPVKFAQGSETTNFVVMNIQGDNPNDFTVATFGDAQTLQPVQSVISLSGSRQTSVSVGEVVTLNKDAEGKVVTVKTSVDPSNVLIGSVLLTLNGSIVGIKTALYEDKTVFMPINAISALAQEQAS